MHAYAHTGLIDDPWLLFTFYVIPSSLIFAFVIS